MANTNEYGGFWARTAAYSVDIAIVTVLCLAVAVGCSFLGPIGAMVSGVAAFLLQLLYWPVMESSARQATFGKQLLGLQVTTVDGERTSFMRALGRNLAKIISSLLLCIGFLMIAFTGKKQGLHDMIAGCTVPRTGRSNFMKALMATVLATVVAGAAGYYYVTEMLLPQMKDEVMGSLDQAMKGDMEKMQRDMKAEMDKAQADMKAAPGTPATAPAAPAAPPLPAVPAPDFEALVGAPLTGYERPNTVRAGPAILELSSFFPASFWLKVNLPQIKDIDAGPPPEVTVKSVLDPAGKNWYDAANTFEKDAFFRRARLTPEAKPSPHFEGTRTVNIEKGLSEGSLQKVEGELKVFIAAEVRSEALQASDIGKDKTVNGASITLKSLNGADAVLHYRGVAANLLNVRGVAQGKLVEVESRRLPGDAKTVDMDMPVKFKAPVTIVEVVTASGIAERSFPFVLTRGGTAGAPGATPAARAIKDEASKGEATKGAAKTEAAREAAAPVETFAKPTAPQPAPQAARERPAPRRPAPAAARAAAPAPQPTTPAPAPAAAPAQSCIVKPVMTEADLEICRRDRSPGISAVPLSAAAPTAAAPVTMQATPNKPACVIKPVMTAADLEVCRPR